MCAMTWLRSTVCATDTCRRLKASSCCVSADARSAARRTSTAAACSVVFGRRLFDQLVAVTEQHGDQVVEVVGDAGGEAADRFHLLRLAQLGLEPLALAQVARDRGDADHLPSPTSTRACTSTGTGLPLRGTNSARNERGALSAPSLIICLIASR